MLKKKKFKTERNDKERKNKEKGEKGKEEIKMRKIKKAREKRKKIHKIAETRKKQANCGSKAVRSPKAASWALRTKNLGPAGLFYTVFVKYITVGHCEVTARNGPITAGDKPQWFSHFFSSRPLYT